MSIAQDYANAQLDRFQKESRHKLQPPRENLQHYCPPEILFIVNSKGEVTMVDAGAKWTYQDTKDRSSRESRVIEIKTLMLGKIA